MTKNRNTWREYCEQKLVPIISKNTQGYIQKLLHSHKPKRCLEIGSAEWYSTARIGHTIQEREGKLISTEVCYPAYLRAIHNIHSYPNITLYPRDIRTVSTQRYIHHKIDFVFIDGNKSQYGEYIEKVEPLLSSNCIILLDDVIKFHNKLSSLYEYLQQKQIFYTIEQLDSDDGVMLIHKKWVSMPKALN